MLTKIRARPERNGGIFAIIAAKYNAKYTDALVRTAEDELRQAGAESLEVVRVPGSFEVPVVAATMAESGAFDAIICFGAILRGQTTHAQQIADGVTMALAELQVVYRTPIIHGVLLFENEEQANIRCLGPEHNRGTEAARTAMEMFHVMQSLGKGGKGIRSGPAHRSRKQPGS